MAMSQLKYLNEKKVIQIYRILGFKVHIDLLFYIYKKI